MKPSECGSALYRGQVVGCDLVKVPILIPYLEHKTSDSAFLTELCLRKRLDSKRLEPETPEPRPQRDPDPTLRPAPR